MSPARRLLAALALTVLSAAGARAAPVEEHFVVVSGGARVGHLDVIPTAGGAAVDFDVKNNGRGPTVKETIAFGADGRPSAWTVSGATTFGSKIDERFQTGPAGATWRDSTGPGRAGPAAGSLYVAQSASPYADEIYARALLASPGQSLAALPGGRLQLTRGEAIELRGQGGPVKVVRYDLTGIDLDPTVMLLTEDGRLFAEVDPRSVLVRKGYEGEADRLRTLAGSWQTARFEALQSHYAHRYEKPVRIVNVRLFDPKRSALTAPVSVLVRGRAIVAVEPPDEAATPGEVRIDGAGGVIVPGFYEMHAHIGEEGALLNLLAGITTVRDMGNDNAVLDDLVQRIDSGRIGGPHVVRSGFIEGQSPYSAKNGILVANQAEALDAVRWYGARGYWQIKIYNSMNPAWVPAMVTEAHKLGMRVAGHVPAFSTADDMIRDGYDEMTHINQFMLGWVMTPGEDTRTLFRLTAMKRFPSLDLQSPRVQTTIQMMVDGRKAIDPTLGIHEQLTENRDGVVPPGAVDYIEHMPIGYRRSAMKAWADVSAPGDDALYRGAFDKILAVVRMLHDRGVFIVFGTDTGGSFTYHRELELYQKAGMSAPEILTRATLDSARYLGQDQTMGSVEKGKLADFFLIPGDPTANLKAIKTISMVVKDGVFYYPSEIYPSYGIAPFTAPPRIIGAEQP